MLELLNIIFLIIIFQRFWSLGNRISSLEEKVSEKETSHAVLVKNDIAPTAVAVSPQDKSITVPKAETIQTPFVSNTTHEEDFGSILTKVGIAILILGVGFFLNYINNKGLLSYNVKFIIGLISGGVMIGVAEYVKDKSLTYTQLLRGGGFVVWFLSIFVGSVIYSIFSTETALVLTAGVTGLSFLVSVREKTETTFFIGTLGAYLVPFIAGSYMHDAMSTVYVLWYVSIINIGIVLAARSMDWMRSITVGFVFSWLILFSLYGNVEDLGWKVQWLFTTIYALTYLIVFVIRDIQQSKELAHAEYSTIATVIHTCIYGITSYAILYTTVLAPYIGFLVALLAVVHFLAYMAIRNLSRKTDHPSALTHLVLAIVLITAAIPLQLDGPLVTMIWFIEGVVLSYLATIEEFKGKLLMYVLGFGGIIAGIVHMIAFGNYSGVRDGDMIVFNQQYLVWLFVILLTQAIAYIWNVSIKDDSITSAFKQRISGGVMFLVLLGQLCFVGLTVGEIYGLKYLKAENIYTEQYTKITELENYYGEDNVYQNEELQQAKEKIYDTSNIQVQAINREFSFIYILFFTIMTVIYLMIGLLRNNILVRRLGVVSLVITVMQLFSLAWDLGAIYRITAFVGLGIVLLIIGYIYMRYNKKNNIGAGTVIAGVFALTLCCSTHIQASVVQPSDWSHVTTFSSQYASTSELSNNSWYIAPVDSTVWSKSAVNNQGDMRIVNAKQEEIPYIIVKQGVVADVQAPIQNTNTQAKILENTIQTRGTVSNRVLVVDTGKEGQVYTGISFQKLASSQNFRKAVRVYISDTQLGVNSPAWRIVEQKGLVYNYVDPTGFSVEDMNIAFPNMASRYIKIIFEDDLDLREKGVSFGNQIYITGVYMIYENRDTTTGATIKNYISGNFDFTDAFKDNTSNSFTQTIQRLEEHTETKSTEIYLKDVHAMTSLVLHVDEKNTNFNRDVVVQGSLDAITWQTVATDRIYRIDSPIFTGESLGIKTPVTTYPYVRIIVHNKNDTPLQFERAIDITMQKIGLLFKAEGVDVQTLTFLIGNKHALPPTYEIKKTIAYVNGNIPAYVTLLPIHKNLDFIPEETHVPFGEKFPYIVNMALVVFVLVLGYLGYVWTKKA
jgi:Predicted membrane protein (DUF2339)